MTSCHRPPRVRRGYTLVELVVSTAIMAILMTGMASSIFLAGKAFPDGSTPASSTISVAEALNVLVAEVTAAQTIIANTQSTIEFTVPRRNGAAGTETIQYTWNGAAGAPLIRRVNQGVATNVFASVQQFTLNYATTLTPNNSGGSQAGSTYRLQSVGITLVGGVTANSRLDTTVFLANLPAVTGP